MVAIHGYFERQGHDGVVGGQVIGPQERLLAQLDRAGKEIKHGKQDGHLQQHRYAAAQRVNPHLLVELHLLLLKLLHVIAIFFFQFFQLGLQDFHLGH